MIPRIAAALTALAVAAGVTACGGDSEKDGSRTDPVTVRLGAIKASACAPTTLWEKHLPAGSKVVTTYFTAPADQVTALLSGSIDVACTGLTIAVVANSQQQPIRVISQIANKGTGVIVGKDSSLNSVADLRGKKIGYPPNSIHDVLLRELLQDEGLNPATDVTLVKVNLADMPAALCDGQVDAFVGNEPNSSIPLLRGCGRSLVSPYDTPVGAVNAGLLTSGDLVEKKPNLLRNVVAANAAAVAEVTKDATIVPTVAESWGFDRAATAKSLENLGFAWKTDDAFVRNYQALADRLKVIGLVKTDVDVSAIVASELSEGVTDSGGS